MRLRFLDLCFCRLVSQEAQAPPGLFSLRCRCWREQQLPVTGDPLIHSRALRSR